MSKNFKMLPMSVVEPNKGQMDGLRKNPRKISDEKYEQLKTNIVEYPELLEYRSLLVYPMDECRYIIIGGNMRYKAMEELEYTECPCDILPKETPLNNLNAYVAIENVHYGEWDMDLLRQEWNMQELIGWNVDAMFDDCDFPSEEECEEESSIQVVEDDGFDAEKVKSRTSLGDLWILGNHRLVCGDSTIKENLDKLMGSDLADMVFTDPPYGVAIGDKNKMLKETNHGTDAVITENIANDDLPVDELYPILVGAMRNCRESCKDDASYYITAPMGGSIGLMMMRMMEDAGLPLRHTLIWEKNSPTFSLGRLDYEYQHEPIFYTWTKRHHNYRKGENRTTIWKYDKPRKCDLHPTMKPVQLVANCMLDSSRSGDIILDVFGGSGTTIVAAEQLGRKARLMELSPHYCDVIVSRWEQMTGCVARKE